MKKKRRTLLTIRGRDDSTPNKDSWAVADNDEMNIDNIDKSKHIQVSQREKESVEADQEQEERSILSRMVENESSGMKSHFQDGSTAPIPKPEIHVNFGSEISEWKDMKQESAREKYFVRCCFSNEYRK